MLGDRVFTADELAARAISLVGELRCRGLRRGARVAFTASNTVETLDWIHALLEIGATLVPLHPRLTDEERTNLLADSRPHLFIDSGREPSLLRTFGEPVAAEVPLALVYTSGTEGRPKAAKLGRRSFVGSFEATSRAIGWRESDRWLLCMPLAHVGGLSVPLRCLAARRAVVIVPGRFDAKVVLEAMVRSSVTIASLVPTMLTHLLDAGLTGRLVPALRVLLIGGAATPPELLRAARSAGLPALCTYGLTETCSQVTLQRPDDTDDLASAGYPLPGVELRIIDGEIQVRTSSVFDGYDDPGAKGQPFTADGWLRTGDLGRVDELGRLHVDTRRSDLIVTGGENVYPTEVEHVVAAIPGVREAAVFGVDDALWGARVVVALVWDETLPRPSRAALREFFASRLSPPKRPRAVAFLEALPRTSSAKVQRHEVAVVARPLLVDLENLR